jgi:hypothetical protein
MYNKLLVRPGIHYITGGIMMKATCLVLLLALAVGLVAVGIAAAEDTDGMKVVFEDDFSAADNRWIILGGGIHDHRVSAGPNNEYLVFGDYEGHALLRIPNVVTNEFELEIELDMSTDSSNWFGIRFGTTHADPTKWSGPGHIIMIRTGNGSITFMRQPPGSWKVGDDFVLGSAGKCEGIQTVTLKVTPSSLEFTVDDYTVTYDDRLVVDPGCIDLMAIKSGPLKLYNVKLSM